MTDGTDGLVEAEELELAEANAATWVTLLRRHARLRPAHPALRSPGGSCTFAELDRRADRAATALARLGVGPGDRVAVLMSNRIEFVEALAGTHRLGAIAVPVNFRLVAPEITYQLTHSGARVLVTDAERATVALAAVAETPSAIEVLVVGDTGSVLGGSIEGGVAAVARSWSDALEEVGTARPPLTAATIRAWDPGAPAVLVYTSGTTGRPKGAVVTYLNLLLMAIVNLQTGNNDSGGAVTLLSPPLFHVAGLSLLFPSMLLGQTIVLGGSAAFDPVATLDLVEAEGVTAMFLVPTQWQAVCDQPGVADRHLELRSMSWGASPALPSTLEAMGATFPGVPNVAFFGQTEMAAVSCALDGEDAVRKFGSVGRPIAIVDARVVDEEMHDVPDGEVGEIVYRGPALTAGYWEDPEATAASRAGGWFHSGDLVRRDDEGFVYVVDRKKDMIISGGENIYSSEVEQAIDGLPSVREVAVIGVPHPRWVEAPLAVVTPSDPDHPPTEDEVKEWLRSRLASYKKPAAVVVVDTLPRNASGKVLKTELRRRFTDVLQS